MGSFTCNWISAPSGYIRENSSFTEIYYNSKTNVGFFLTTGLHLQQYST